MWTIFKVFIEFVTILLLFYVLVFWPPGMWDFTSPTRNQTHTLCIGRQSLKHWATREVCIQLCSLLNKYFLSDYVIQSTQFWVLGGLQKTIRLAYHPLSTI